MGIMRHTFGELRRSAFVNCFPQLFETMMKRKRAATETMQRSRCSWCTKDTLYETYHDSEWGKKETSGRKLFESVCLEGHQSGLSWLTILKRREKYRTAFRGFDAEKMVKLNAEDLMDTCGLINHKGKIQSSINNAKALVKHFGKGRDGEKKFSAFLWSFAKRKEERRARRANDVCETKTKESEAMSKALKAKGFSFVGATTMHALMQSAGMVDDHDAGCFLHASRTAPAKERAKSTSTMSAMERRNAKIAEQKRFKMEKLKAWKASRSKSSK